MRRLVPFALVVPFLAGCAFLPSGGSPLSSGPPKVFHGCTMLTPNGRRPCSGRPGEVRRWIVVEGMGRAEVPGARLFTTAGCAACHTYAGSGKTNLGAPDLTAIGSRNLGIDFQIRHLQCPSCVVP